jgi:hypothetical protein
VEEFITKWGAAVGIFLVTGTLMQALNMSIGAKAGDPGFKGVWFVWKRFFLIILGVGLGALIPLLGLSSPIGEGYGPGIINGLVASFAAGTFYEIIVGSAKASLQHRIAKGGDTK